MLFNSLEYLIFLPLVVGIFFALPHRLRWGWLLAASCVFYMFFIPAYILILAVTIGIDYFCAIKIDECQGKSRKKWLLISIVSTCLVLFIFKYFNFFTTSFVQMGKVFGWEYPLPILSIILPIGLSFHTFQSLSYVVEVYHGRQKPEKHFGIYSLYVMFFPQLVAGPIERPQNLLHQFREEHQATPSDFLWGLRRIAWGVFKKVVIADRCAIEVNYIYANPGSHEPAQLIMATFLFAIQIYCDFSGYSDIALGSARLLGFRLMENFKAPYFSPSVGEFWRRWHVSLSTWFKDYVYVPLGGSRRGEWKTRRNLMLTFLLSGLWHGANWTYIIWGTLNGAYQVFGRWTSSLRNRIFKGIPAWPRKLAATILTFGLIMAAWVFFRAETLQDACTIWTTMANGFFHGFHWVDLTRGVKLTNQEFRFLLLMIGFMLVAEYGFYRGTLITWYKKTPSLVRQIGYVSFGLLILLTGVFGHSNFIYFQF